MKKSIRCPHCDERITNIHVSVHTYYVYNPRLDKITKRIGVRDYERIGHCPKCSGLVDSNLFEEEQNEE
jgi:phage FluMu protein Com